MTITVDLQGLQKNYGHVEAVKPLTLQLFGGTIVGLLGDNGAGKSTLLRMLADVTQPTAGMASVWGQKVGQGTHSLVAYMPDASNLFPYMTVSQLIDWHNDMFTDFDKNMALYLCQRMELKLKARSKALSKGYNERVSLMLTLARNVPLYIMDEPLGGADPRAKHMLKSIFVERLRPDSTLLISSHLLSDMEDVLAEALFMREGVIFHRANVPYVRQTLGQSLDQYYNEVILQ